MPLEEMLMIGLFVGVPVLLIGVVAANMAVYDMQDILNADLLEDERIAPWRVLGKGANFYGTIAKYRAKYGDDRLSRQLRVWYWLCGVGGVVGIGSGLLSKALYQ